MSVEIFPTENPAHRIIDRARANRKVNDGMRERSYRYTSYSKTIFTAEVDSALRTDSAKFAALRRGRSRKRSTSLTSNTSS